jgi:tetratricopeptide (TPR) repeat protein
VADLLECRAWAWLNQTSHATDALVRVAESGAVEEDVLQAYRDLIHARRGRWEATERLTGADTLRVPYRDAMGAVVRAAMLHDRIDLAEAMLDDWEQKLPKDSAVNYLRGRMLEAREKTERAADQYEIASAKQPRYSAAHFRRGVLRRNERDFAGSETSYLQCRSPYHQIARLEAGESRWQREAYAAAWELVEPLLSEPWGPLFARYLEVDEYVDDDRPALIGARIQSSQGDLEAAVRLWQRVREFHPRNFEATKMLADHLGELGRHDESLAERQRLQDLLDTRQRTVELRNQFREEPGNLELHCDLAEAYLHGESLAEGIVELQAILRSHPDCKRAHRLLAIAYREKARIAPSFEELAVQHERLGN